MLVVRTMTALRRWDGEEEVPVAPLLKGRSIHRLDNVAGRGNVELAEELLDQSQSGSSR